jgi:hypothetical protein
MSAGQIWSRYVRYIGAGAVAAAGIVAVARALPTMYQSLAAVLRGLRGSDVPAAGGAVPRTDRDIPGWIVLAAPAAVVVTLFAVPGLLAGDMPALPRLVAALGVAIFGRGLRGGVVAHRGPHRRQLQPDLGHDAGDVARRLGRLRGAGLERSLRARGHPHGGDRGLHRRLEGGRHLAGPQDGQLVGATPARSRRPVPRRRLRLLGGGGHGAAARPRYTSGRRTCPRRRPRS